MDYDKNLWPETISQDQFLEMLQRHQELKSEVAFVNPSYVRLYIGGGLNQIYFTFTNRYGNKFYPEPLSVHCSKYISNQQEMNGAGLYRYDDPLNSAYFKMKPFEQVFYASLTNHTKPVWSFSLAFLLYSGIAATLSSLEVRDVRRLGNLGSGTSPMPSIQLDEAYIENGEIKYKRWISHTFSNADLPYRKFVFG